jgi:TrmH family RNA methyltransferase
MTAPRRAALARADVARLRSLREKRGRDEAGLFAVEGEKAVSELLAAGYPLEEIYATDAWAGRRTVAVSAADMARISHFPTPSSVLALARLRREPLAAGALSRGLTLALDGVQDPGNVGTLWRIADWFACARLLLSPDCADPYAPKVIQASMGSFGRVPLHVADLPGALAAAGVPVLGCELAGEDIHRFPPPADAVVVIGSEGRGLSPEVSARLTHRVTIPGHGRAESLNAAVAAAIVCDNLRRPR